jgi:plastocyanin
MAIQKTQGSEASILRWIVIASIAVIAFLASNRFAVASSSSNATGTPAAIGGGVAGGTGGAVAGGGGCCGGGAAGPQTTKKADVSGDVQKIAVDVSKGYYDPSTIELKAGVPAEITFSQSGGCTAQVQSQELGFFEDLSAGPKTVKVGALQPGTYSFTCGMGMVSGSIVVK